MTVRGREARWDPRAVDAEHPCAGCGKTSSHDCDSAGITQALLLEDLRCEHCGMVNHPDDFLEIHEASCCKDDGDCIDVTAFGDPRPYHARGAAFQNLAPGDGPAPVLTATCRHEDGSVWEGPVADLDAHRLETGGWHVARVLGVPAPPRA